MTPAVDVAKQNKVTYKLHEYFHDTQSKSYGLEASEKLGIDKERVFKTIVVMCNNKSLAVGIIPVSSMLNMKLIAKATDFKKCIMASKLDVERSTGYVLGGVSPLGQKRPLKTIIDLSAKEFETIYVSAGRRGLEIELNPNDLKMLVNGQFDNICL